MKKIICETKTAELVDDVNFYDEYISNLSLEDQAKFFEEFPEFMNAEEISEEKKCDIWQKLQESIK